MPPAQQHGNETRHVVKVFLPCAIHHQLHALLVARHETWQQWAERAAADELDSEADVLPRLKSGSSREA